ncbi:MAG TPA: CoA pyrophosphatase [Dermatophilaceae bacterium]|nr:CoA pyrophosphatase [Dermatophilaceae bacterium]
MSAPPAWMQTVVAAIRGGAVVWPPATSANGRPAAVLMLFGPTLPGLDGEDVVLTERAADLRSHAGQVSFPGGAIDPGETASAAALREAQEEIGLDPAGVEVLAELPPIGLAPSGYLVTPVLAWWARPSPVRVVDPVEVARVVRAPVAELVDPARRFSVTHPSGYVGPAFNVDGLLVWGFTGTLLAGLLDLAGLAQEWDIGRHEPLPERFGGGSRR